MALNLKNPETQRLVEELAGLTGESGAGLTQRLLAIGRDCAPRLKEPYRSTEHGDLLYDDRGLPK